MRADVYLTFDGNCKEAMTFYKSVFGGEFQTELTYAESEMKDSTPEHLQSGILQCSLPFSKTFVLMGCDRHPVLHDWKGEIVLGNNFEVSVSPETVEETDQIFAALSAGGTVVRPLENKFWGSYHGICKDKYGIQWMFDIWPKDDKNDSSKTI
jgi:PhnB protein